MKKLALLIPFIISSCALFGPTYTGETTASSLLKSDTERNINLAFRAIHNCTPKQIHTVDSAYETWTVKGCNQTEVFKIKYISDGQGGTYINMTTSN